MATKTTANRSTKLMEARGYKVAVVEHYNYWTQRRHDLFELFDLLCIHRETGETCAVQSTSLSNISSRIKKITDHENTPIIRRANWKILVHGWKKSTKGYTVREENLS